MPLVITACLLAVAVGGDDALLIQPLQSAREVEVRLLLSPQDAAVLRTRVNIDFETGRKYLHLALVNDNGAPGPAMFARYALQQGRLVLKPRYALTPGASYVAIAGKRVGKTYRVPAQPGGEPPEVTGVFPSGDSLPANCLKFYLHFSQPMREGRQIFQQVLILDDQNNVIADPWRRTELWSDDARRLTIWIHPGRIKRGLNLREEFGPVLAPNRAYRLVLTTAVRSARGASLAKPFVKHFRTTAEDHERPLPARWRMHFPRRGGVEPLRVQFGKPLDRALLKRFLVVHDAQGPVAGEIYIGKAETSWSFTPREPWQGATLFLKVSGRLEDVAGNTPLRPFDADLRAEPLAPPQLSLPIRLREE